MAKSPKPRKPARAARKKPTPVPRKTLEELGVKQLRIIQTPNGKIRVFPEGFSDPYQLRGWIETHVNPPAILKTMAEQVKTLGDDKAVANRNAGT